MKIDGKVYCLFEQSGVFKNEFIKLGIEALDYDIQNEFDETDYIIDLFHQIELEYDGKTSIFSSMVEKDLVIAFFPCTYFSCMSQMLISYTHKNYQKYTPMERCKSILERSKKREYYFSLAVKLICIAKNRNLRLIMENPWSEQTFLKQNFPFKPTFIDKDRTLRGDYYVKPTAYWFINCEPTNGKTIQQRKRGKAICEIPNDHNPGICNTERSLISSDYARNFICDFILGKRQKNSELSLFDL